MTKRIIAIFMSFLLFVFHIGCAGEQKDKSDSYTRTDGCTVNGRTMYFLSDEDKKLLRKPLKRALSNETHEIYDDTAIGELIGYEPYDKNEPTVAAGYSCGLYDVTGDGMPELLVHPHGYHGSSGTVTYYVYDIFSNNKIGEIDGGNAESWCVYYFTETDELRSVGSYWRRGGYPERYRVMTLLDYDEESNTCGEELYLYAHFSIEGRIVDVKDDDGDTFVGEWVESYPYASYKVRGKGATLDEYYYEMDWFNSNCVRIPETELQMIRWWDVSSDDDDRFERAEKMVDALLSTDQKFIIP